MGAGLAWMGIVVITGHGYAINMGFFNISARAFTRTL